VIARHRTVYRPQRLIEDGQPLLLRCSRMDAATRPGWCPQRHHVVPLRRSGSGRREFSGPMPPAARSRRLCVGRLAATSRRYQASRFHTPIYDFVRFGTLAGSGSHANGSPLRGRQLRLIVFSCSARPCRPASIPTYRSLWVRNRTAAPVRCLVLDLFNADRILEGHAVRRLEMEEEPAN